MTININTTIQTKYQEADTVKQNNYRILVQYKLFNPFYSLVRGLLHILLFSYNQNYSQCKGTPAPITHYPHEI